MKRTLIVKVQKEKIGSCPYTMFLPPDMTVVHTMEEDGWVQIRVQGPRCPVVPESCFIPIVELDNLKRWLADESNYK